MKRMKNSISRRSVGVVMLTGVAMLCGARSLAADPPSEPVRPWIGITSTVKDGAVVSTSTYARAVRRSGGVPVIIPVMKDESTQAEYLRRLDGLVVIGGGDIPPEAYGEEPHPTVKVMPRDRWEWERRLIRHWLDSDKPLLGICLGAQMTNVVSGGSLVQDIPSQVGDKVVHRKDGTAPPAAGGTARHEVTIERDSRLHRILAVERTEVLSCHHQSIKRVGKGLRVVARSDDGVVEALEMPGERWGLLLQWHPERMAQPHCRAVFGALVSAARAVKE
ncbi:MAG: gamma-glutamyl-gamma-aminobutyrate hydrolase family protein [Candidatus Nealsonbacteria bacterium]|nr:gamma-glutamyl-gamma-aminobutyrate hydrolase family protein [Candidatus Nealsonbacteria bacterium]